MISRKHVRESSLCLEVDAHELSFGVFLFIVVVLHAKVLLGGISILFLADLVNLLGLGIGERLCIR